MPKYRILVKDIETDTIYVPDDEWVRQKLGICKMQSEIKELQHLKKDLLLMMLDQAKQEIIDHFKLMSSYDKPIQTRSLNVWIWNFGWSKGGRFYHKALRTAMEALLADQTIIRISQGKGRNRIWKLNPEKED